jgi:hypothetical protein
MCLVPSSLPWASCVCFIATKIGTRRHLVKAQGHQVPDDEAQKTTLSMRTRKISRHGQ